MRVLLVRPPTPRHTVGLRHIMICEPLELEYVAAGLDGHAVEIVDMILERDLPGRLARFRPDVVGTSCYINGVNEVKKICRAVKRWNPTCHTVVGGVHATRAPEDFADPAIDCLVLCDGTSTIGPIVRAFNDGRLPEEVPGLAFPQPDGSLRFTPAPKRYMPDPDTLPLPRRDLVEHLRHRYYYLFHQPVTIMKTTWGCWYRCNFCVPWTVTGGTPYSRSPESIVDELATIDTHEVYIVDDIFLINRKRLSSIASLIRERGIRKNYLVYARADFVAENEDVIAEWAEIGLKAVIVGLEATTNPELSAMNKVTSVDQNVGAIEVLRRNGVDIYASLIPQPDYTPEDWAHLQRFIFEHDLYYLNISPLTPMPGSDVWDSYRDRLIVPREAHGLWDLSHVVLPTRMPLNSYYRALMRVYVRSIMDIRRAGRLQLRTRPPVWSRTFLRLWIGVVRIFFQFLFISAHHRPGSLRRAMDTGPGP